MKFITPEEYFKIQSQATPLTLATLAKRSKSKERCEVCGLPAWKIAATGLCFHCTTGESDSTYDYELIKKGET